MNKKIISDIITTKRSIRQIPISAGKKKILEKEIEDFERAEEGFSRSENRRLPNWQRKPLNPKFVIWLIAIICLLALFFGVSIIFSSATVIITPKTQKISFNNESYTAKLSSNDQADLFFEVLKVKQSASEVVNATEEKEVSQKASGKIVIYNNYSSAPQRLINNTRFEANNGKIYRINTSVVVPGLKKVNGQAVPGSIEATVFADQAGEDYNLKVADLAGDFKIPGFKGDVRYNGFYARLKEDIAGGFIGKQRIVGEEERKAAEESIKNKLKEQLLKELYAVLPENYLIFKDGYSVDYSRLPDTPVDSDKVKINIEGTLNGIVFNNLKLAKYLALKKIADFDQLPVIFIPLEDLSVTFEAADSTGWWKNSTIKLKLTGEALIKWQYDTEMIKKDLAGKKESDLKALAVKYKNSVTGIKVIFRPVWTRYFPDNLNKIKITEEIL